MIMVSPLLISLLLNAGLPTESATERRLLHDAVKASAYFDRLQAFNQQCPEAASLLIIPEQERLEQALTNQLHLNKSSWDSFINNESSLKRFAATLPSAAISCTDTDTFQNLADDYELALFSVEIATPLAQAPASDNDKARSKQQQQANKLQELFNRSSTTALVSIVPKRVLNNIEQANYLHPDYEGDYIYIVEQGWKKYTKHYMGMPVYLDDTTRARTPDKWVIFLDAQGGYIESIPLDSLNKELKALGKADWSFDPSGNLLR